MRDALLQRLQLLQAASDSPELVALLLERCRRDIVFWFEQFCWTFDPRLRQPHRPFRLYPFQERFVLELCRAIETGEDLLVEKSRDMGASWLVLLTFQHYWLFAEGSHFHVGSRKEEAVDRKGDLSTLFEKLRYNLRWLPAWLRPEGYAESRHASLLRLVNPANGNSITGESSNANFARGGRYKAVLKDEFAFWPLADLAYAAAGQSSPCRVVVGTPFGKANKFAELRFSETVRVVSLHWSLHPGKDTAWYARQRARMSEDEVARELDINYNLSVKNRVFTGFSEQHKGDFAWDTDRPVIRSWDFGYHCPACLFLQRDGEDRLSVLAEVVGRQELLAGFAARVLAFGRQHFPGAAFEDVCDPAGSQKSDKSDCTSIEILNSLGIYPFYRRSPLLRGIELIRMKLAETLAGQPALRVDRRCTKLIDAFEGGYRYGSEQTEVPLEQHPYEDVMDCLRYAVVHKYGIGAPAPRKPRPYRPLNPHTGY